jgi:hypothetical protein
MSFFGNVLRSNIPGIITWTCRGRSDSTKTFKVAYSFDMDIMPSYIKIKPGPSM